MLVTVVVRVTVVDFVDVTVVPHDEPLVVVSHSCVQVLVTVVVVLMVVVFVVVCVLLVVTVFVVVQVEVDEVLVGEPVMLSVTFASVSS